MTPYYEQDGVTIYHGDCREIECPADLIIADPPYGDTSLSWDKHVTGWVPAMYQRLSATGSMWVFGSLRFFMETTCQFTAWKLAQDLVWEKHNGSSFHADRFKRVHEHVVQFYRGKWGDVYKSPVTTSDATARAVRRKKRPPHTGHIEASSYVSIDGGPRLMRSVLQVRSCHGMAEHPTQKPVGIIEPLILYSSKPEGIVLDPFMGAGSVLVAAQALGRRAIGIEIEERYCEIAAKRLQRAT